MNKGLTAFVAISALLVLIADTVIYIDAINSLRYVPDIDLRQESTNKLMLQYIARCLFYISLSLYFWNILLSGVNQEEQRSKSFKEQYEEQKRKELEERERFIYSAESEQE